MIDIYMPGASIDNGPQGAWSRQPFPYAVHEQACAQGQSGSNWPQPVAQQIDDWRKQMGRGVGI